MFDAFQFAIRSMHSSTLCLIVLLLSPKLAIPFAYSPFVEKNYIASMPKVKTQPGRMKVGVTLKDPSRELVNRDGAVYVDHGGYWFCPAIVGGQQVDMLIDTGSSDLYV